MKFPAEMKIVEQPSVVLIREGDRGSNFSLYFEAEDPVTGQSVTLKLLGASAEPQGGDLGQERLDRIERERAKVQAAFAAKD